MTPLAGRNLVTTLLAGMVLTTTPLRAEEGLPGVAAKATPARESIESLDVLVEVLRDGRVRLEQTFVLRVTGASIRRGPVLNYLTAFRGPGGLVLENGMEVEEVWRNDVPEPFRAVSEGGHLRLTCGASDVFLEHGRHTYVIRSIARGDWKYEGGLTMGAFDVLGPLHGFAIDSARVRFRLPDGVSLDRKTVALRTATGKLVAYDTSSTTTEWVVRTTEPLGEGSAFFLNAVWPSGGFVTKSHWLEIIKQHPKLPLTGFSALLLFCVLLILIGRARRRVNGPGVPVAVPG